MIGEIAAASREQAQGIEQISQALSQMDSITQNNAANAEESASASEELNAQANGMKETVEEMLRMVGGGGNGRSRPVKALPASGNGHRIKMIAAPHPAAIKKATAPVRRPAHGEDVIPMDDGFNEF